MFDPTLIILFIVAIVVFLLAREFVCWYFKITEAVNHLIDIHNLLVRVTNTVEKLEKAPQNQAIADTP